MSWSFMTLLILAKFTKCMSNQKLKSLNFENVSFIVKPFGIVWSLVYAVPKK